MNKKANIPIAIFVLGVLLLCGVVLLSFSVFDAINKKSSAEAINSAINLNSYLEKYYFYKNLGMSGEDAISFLENPSFPENKLFIDKTSSPMIIGYKTKEIEIYYGVIP